MSEGVVKIKEKSTVIVSDEKEPILYYVDAIADAMADVVGVHYRVRRRVDISLLRLASEEEIDKETKKTELYKYKITSFRSQQSRKYILGKVLHLDGDREYLNKCLELYEKVGIYAYGAMVNEEEMPNTIAKYMAEINPDIIVLTGHDFYSGEGMKDIENYANSKHFMDAVKEIRKNDKNAVVIAGACQSNFEALIAGGADFASSPKRINIHTYDPAVIAIKVATTSFLKVVKLEDVHKYIEEGKDAFNGLETLGKMRLLL